jgi:hypothetical protein
MMEAFTSEKKVLMVSEAVCLDHQVSINSVLPPPYDVTFVRHVKKLEEASDKSAEEQEREYLGFVKNYGTHFLTTARFGAKIIAETTFSRSELTSGQLEEEKECRDSNEGFELLVIKMGKSDSTCTEYVKGTNSSRTTSTGKSRVRTVGSRLDGESR